MSAEKEEIVLEPEDPEILLPEPWDFRAEGYIIFDFEESDYHIISGKLTEEQVEQLAKTVIDDLLAEDPASEQITLFFYSDLDAVSLDKADVARIDWTTEETGITIIR